jgi:hypothetical protein
MLPQSGFEMKARLRDHITPGLRIGEARWPLRKSGPGSVLRSLPSLAYSALETSQGAVPVNRTFPSPAGFFFAGRRRGARRCPAVCCRL